MSGKSFLLDSNFIIRLSKGDEALIEFINESPNYFAVSVITYMEVMGYNFNDDNEYNMIRDVFEIFEILYIDEVIAQKTIDVRKIKKVKIPDAIIAATALSLDFTLVTANFDDFKNIPNLKILNK